jgi:hypothetical protein
MATMATGWPAASSCHIWEPIATSSRSLWPPADYTLKNIELGFIGCGVLEYLTPDYEQYCMADLVFPITLRKIVPRT